MGVNALQGEEDFLIGETDRYLIADSTALQADDGGETEVIQVVLEEDFNRPDGAVANGWTNMSGNDGGDLAIDDGALTAAAPVVNAGIYRPLTFDAPLIVSCDITEGNGFGGLADRFTMQLLVGSGGAINDGYGIMVYRGDQNFANSSIVLMYNGVNIGAEFSTFQFSETLHLEVTFNPDGSITGTVSQPGSSFDFAFPPFAFVSSGDNFAIVSGGPDPRTGTPLVAPTLDNLIISSDALNADPIAVDDTHVARRLRPLDIDAEHGVLANDDDPDGGGLQVIEVDGVAANVGVAIQGDWGTLTLQADGSFVYVAGPREPHKAPDVFTYTVSDGAGGTDTATLTIFKGGPGHAVGGQARVADRDAGAVERWEDRGAEMAVAESGAVETRLAHADLAAFMVDPNGLAARSAFEAVDYFL